MGELEEIIKTLKRRKPPGPDNITHEVFKEMNTANKLILLDLLNKWWKEEFIPEEILLAKGVLILKKGDSANLDNYRPISLLNSTYKMFAAIVQRRLAKTIDPLLQKKQYGFRKDKSTRDAIHCIRRAME